MFGSRIRRTRDGHYEVRLDPWERNLLRSLPGQLRDLLATDDPALERLYPPAYSSDDDQNAEYSRLMRDDLTAGRQSCIDVMERTIDAGRLDEDQMSAWLGALNDLRLVLGTRLDVTEEMYEQQLPDDDPRAGAFALYAYLGVLEEQVVDALARGL